MIKRIIKKLINARGYSLIKISSKNTYSADEDSSYVVVSPLKHNSKENMNRYFSNSDNLEKYVNGRQEFYQKLATKIIGTNSVISKLKICDVGCGPGDLINIIGSKTNDSELFGFDHSEKLIQISEKRFPQIIFKQFDLFEDYNSFKSEFDIVICSEVVEHLIGPKTAVKNLLHMVKSSGFLVLSVPEGRKDSYQGHINFWSPESWNQFIKEVLTEINGNSFKTEVFAVNNFEYNFAIIYK